MLTKGVAGDSNERLGTTIPPAKREKAEAAKAMMHTVLPMEALLMTFSIASNPNQPTGWPIGCRRKMETALALRWNRPAGAELSGARPGTPPQKHSAGAKRQKHRRTGLGHRR